MNFRSQSYWPVQALISHTRQGAAVTGSADRELPRDSTERKERYRYRCSSQTRPSQACTCAAAFSPASQEAALPSPHAKHQAAVWGANDPVCIIRQTCQHAIRLLEGSLVCSVLCNRHWCLLDGGGLEGQRWGCAARHENHPQLPGHPGHRRERAGVSSPILTRGQAQLHPPPSTTCPGPPREPLVMRTRPTPAPAGTGQSRPEGRPRNALCTSLLGPAWGRGWNCSGAASCFQMHGRPKGSSSRFT